MATILSLLVGIGLLATVFNLSLISRWRYVLSVCLFVAVGLYLVHPLTTKINLNHLYGALTGEEPLKLLSIYLICEGLCIVLACHYLTSEGKGDVAEAEGLWPGQVLTMKLRHGLHVALGYFAYLPSVLFLIALVVWQSWLFHNISGMPFRLIALLQACAVVVSLVVLCWSVRAALPQWHWRVEMRILLAMSQVGLAIYLSAMAEGMRVLGDAYEVDAKVTLAVLAGLLALASAGLTAQWIGLNLKRRRA